MKANFLFLDMVFLGRAAAEKQRFCKALWGSESCQRVVSGFLASNPTPPAAECQVKL